MPADTLVFRIYNIGNYPMLLSMAQTIKGKQLVQTRSDINPEKMEIRKFWLTYQNDAAIPLRYTDERHVESSNHNIAFTIVGSDYLEANVSLPKILYGTNVCELIIPPGHRDYSVNNTSPFDHVDYLYTVIRDTVKMVVDLVAQGNFVELDWCDVQVQRIDLCFNQHFESKEEALRYLNLQRGIHKKHSRLQGEASNNAEWKTSITWKTARYYAKIYHKGSEFAQKQSKAIIELNKTRKQEGKQLFSSNIAYAASHIQQLQDYSDKILRYELEFKQSYMSYLFNQKVNKQWSNDWKKCVKVFNYFKANEDLRMNLFNYEARYIDMNGEEQKEQPILVREVNLYHKRYNGDIKKYEYFPFTPKEKKYLMAAKSLGCNNQRDLKSWMAFMQKEVTKVRSFCIRLPKHLPDTTLIASNIDGKKVSNHPFHKTPGDVRFTKSLIIVMLNEFNHFFDMFQVSKKKRTDELVDKIDWYNKHLNQLIEASPAQDDKDRMKKKLITEHSRRNLLQYHFLVSRYSSKELLIQKHYSKATYHRIKKLYQDLTGQKEHVASVHFSHLIERDFTKAYEKLYSDINFTFLTNLYNLPFKVFGGLIPSR